VNAKTAAILMIIVIGLLWGVIVLSTHSQRCRWYNTSGTPIELCQ